MKIKGQKFANISVEKCLAERICEVAQKQGVKPSKFVRKEVVLLAEGRGSQEAVPYLRSLAKTRGLFFWEYMTEQFGEILKQNEQSTTSNSA